MAGVCLCEDSEQAARLIAQTKGTQSPTALVSRQRLIVPDSISATRTAFHLTRTLTKTSHDGVQTSDVQTLPVAGFIYQMSDVHSVALKSAPQTMSVATTGKTCVLRLITSAMWCPSEAWNALSKGKQGPLREELLRLLQDSCPSKVCCVYDAFKLELQGKLMSCCVRVDLDAVPGILKVSGKSWMMIHPLAHLAPTYPTVWANESWPEKLDVLYARASDLGALQGTFCRRTPYWLPMHPSPRTPSAFFFGSESTHSVGDAWRPRRLFDGGCKLTLS